MDRPLEDEFGREVTGVRVSLTDRCNFDCVYCHNEGLGDTRGPMEPDDNEMTAAMITPPGPARNPPRDSIDSCNSIIADNRYSI